MNLQEALASVAPSKPRDGHPTEGALLSIALEAAVQLRIMELERQGGPSDADREEAGRFATLLASNGDRLLYKSARDKHGPSSADMFNGLARGLAVMAYQPGGVTFLGTHWERTLHPPEEP